MQDGDAKSPLQNAASSTSSDHLASGVMMTVTARTAAGKMGTTATAQMTAVQIVHSPLRQRPTNEWTPLLWQRHPAHIWARAGLLPIDPAKLAPLSGMSAPAHAHLPPSLSILQGPFHQISCFEGRSNCITHSFIKLNNQAHSRHATTSRKGRVWPQLQCSTGDGELAGLHSCVPVFGQWLKFMPEESADPHLPSSSC